MFLAANTVPDEEQRKIMIKKVLKFLPTCNYKLLRILCKFLNQIMEYSEENKMSSR
jgi:hypothetical protein